MWISILLFVSILLSVAMWISIPLSVSDIAPRPETALGLSLGFDNEVDLDREVYAWNSFAAMSTLGEQRVFPRDRGVVIVGGQQHWVENNTQVYYTLDALLAIVSLRRAGCKLPVELWHDHDPRLSGGLITSSLGDVVLRDVRSIPDGQTVEKYELAAFALMHTNFREVLYIDADIVAVEDPTQLFEIPEYKRTGAVFWPHSGPYSHKYRYSRVWDVLNISFITEHDIIDNSQMIIDMQRHWREVQLAYFLTHRWKPYWFKAPFYLNGDADMFIFAWLAQRASYFVVNTSESLMGGLVNDHAFCGHTRFVPHPSRHDELLFAHRTLAKLSSWPSHGIPNNALQRYVRGAFQGNAHSDCPFCGHSSRGSYHPCVSLHLPNNTDAYLEVDESSQMKSTLSKYARVEHGLVKLRAAVTINGSYLTENWQQMVANHLPDQGYPFDAPDSAVSTQITSSCNGRRRNTVTINPSDLLAYLDGCILSAPSTDVSFPAEGKHAKWMELPNTTSGKCLRCLAQHEMAQSVLILFYGYPGPNGVFSAALGSRARHSAGLGLTKIITAEAHAGRCNEGAKYLKTHGLDKYVDLHCRVVCGSGDEQTCMKEFQSTYCPKGRLDFLALDFSLALPPKVYRSVLTACRPKVLFVENSGLHWWEWGTKESDSHSNYSENETDSWHHYEDLHLHAAAIRGTGDYRLVLDRKRSGFLGDTGARDRKWRSNSGADGMSAKESAEPRTFSVYMSVDIELSDPC